MKLLRKNKEQTSDGRRRPPATNNPAVFSYYARGSSAGDHNVGRGEEERARNARYTYRPKVRHIPSYLALAAIIAALFYSVLLQPAPRIVLLNTPGTIHREPEAYEEGVQNIWKQSLFNRTKLTVSTDEISQKTQAEFHELADVSIQLPLLGQRPTVVLTPARPALLLISGNGSYYVSGEGKVMSATSEVSKNELGNIPSVRDESGIQAQLGKSVLSTPETAFLEKLFKHLDSANLEVLSVTLPKNAARQADVWLTGRKYYVKFSLDSDPRQAVGTYLALENMLKVEGIIPSEYIDVRVEEKAFYK